jgi:molybdopterin/thiamine biosynthesis adenylyltransferase
MMDLQKHLDYFNPMQIDKPIHVIGVGAIGSHVVEQLVRLGIEDLNLYDFDEVDAHNIANQMYTSSQIGLSKLQACAQYLHEINPDITLHLNPEGWKDQQLRGYVFLCVDNIDLRRAIAEQHKYSMDVLAMYDFRMGLEDAQAYAADWSKEEQKKQFLSTMDFTHEEAKDATPVSACGTTLSVLPTVKTIVSFGVANFINFVKTGLMKKMILINAFDMQVMAL